MPNRFKYISWPSAISCCLSYNKAPTMNGNMKNTKHTTQEIDSETISAVESEGRAITFNQAAKYISR